MSEKWFAIRNSRVIAFALALCCALAAGAARAGVGPDAGDGDVDGTGGFPSVSNLEFHQINWYDSDGTLQVPNSHWGTLEMDVMADPQYPFYLNVVANAGGPDGWIVQNYPLFPQSIGTGSLRQGVDFDIELLSLQLGQPLTTIQHCHTIDTSVLPFPPCTPSLTDPVTPIDRISFTPKVGGPPLPPDVGHPAGFVNVAPVDLSDVIQHDKVEGVQEETNTCLAGAFARSIDWLDTAYKLEMGKSAQQIYQDLRARKVGNPETSYAEDVEAKRKYLEENSGKRGITKILDLAGAIGPVPGVKEETGKDLVEWLKKELQTEDVELHYDTHIITVTGMFQADGKTWIKYRDDEKQGDDAKGDTAEKTAELKFNPGDGIYTFRRKERDNFHEVKVAISESVPPELTVAPNGATSRLAWSPMPNGRTLFDVVQGDLGTLRGTGGDFAAATQSCLANDTSRTSVDYAPTPTPGHGVWFLMRGSYAGGPGSYDDGRPSQIGERDPGIATSPSACPTCSHDKCIVAGTLDPACNPCVASICDADPFCCDTSWDGLCVEEVRTVCASLRCSESRGACLHTLCSEGGPLVEECDSPPTFPSCVTSVCTADPHCCTGVWDALCVIAVESICGMNCE